MNILEYFLQLGLGKADSHTLQTSVSGHQFMALNDTEEKLFIFLCSVCLFLSEWFISFLPKACFCNHGRDASIYFQRLVTPPEESSCCLPSPFLPAPGEMAPWKKSVYHFGHVGNNFVTLCFSSALRLWKIATPKDEAQKGLIHVENIHFFHIFIDGQDHRVLIHRPCIATQLYQWWEPRGSLAHWVLCS